MDIAVLNSTLSILLPYADLNNIILLIVGVLSLLACTLLTYIVHKYTPEEFSSKKVLLLIQLAGCFLYSLLHCLLQPVTPFPHKVLIFTGPFRHFGPTITGSLFVAWCTELAYISCAAITITFNHYIETMEQFKQKNIIFEFFRNLSVARRFFAYAIFDGFIIIITAVALFFSINDDSSLVGSYYDNLRDTYALIDLKSKYGTLEILGGSSLFFMIFYISMLFFLMKNVWTEMEELRPSLSPRTFEILEQLSRLFIMVDITPIVFFFLPTAFFIVIPFLLPSLVSTTGSLIFFSLLTLTLYSVYPFAYYVLLFVGFKYYRQALCRMFSRPFPCCKKSTIHDVTATKASL